jgi:iron complex outermembrane receptor protein
LMPTRIFIPTLIENAMTGNTYGFELAATYKVTEKWRLRPAYTFLIMDLRPVSGSTASETVEGTSPRNEFYLQSSWNFGERWELDLTGRYVDSLPAMGVPKYIVGDARLAWHAKKNLEFSVVGRNLFNGNFYEFGNDSYMGAQATEVQPEVYGQVIWRR